MRFEIGKCYRHSGGKMIRIISAGQTMTYGWCLIAEEAGYANLIPVASDEEAAMNWEEITEKEWIENFS